MLRLLGFAFSAAQRVRGDVAQNPDDRIIGLGGDGLGLTAAQYSRLPTHLAEEKWYCSRQHILEGVVEELEKQFARVLGKERAVFMPTGTLANQLAVRALAGGPSRAPTRQWLQWAAAPHPSSYGKDLQSLSLLVRIGSNHADVSYC